MTDAGVPQRAAEPVAGPEHDTPTTRAEADRLSTEDLRSRLLSHGSNIDRLVFFSDAVIAIALTLLVLEIKVPTDVPRAQLGQYLANHETQIVAYLIGFLVIASNWISHHRKFSVIERFDSGLLWLNLLFLLLVAFVPFPTALVSEYGLPRVAVVMYAGVMTGISLLQLVLWVYAYRRGLMAETVTPALYRAVRLTLYSPLATFALSMLLAFWKPWLGAACWTLAALFQGVVARVHRIAARRGQAGATA